MQDTLYDQVGGEPFFVRLVEGFYAAVEVDALLRPMYPEDLTDAKRHLVMFLCQYWGGPPDYSAERGHPRLRMRHAPFRITKSARDAWMKAMTLSLDELRPEISAEQYGELIAYFDMAAQQMRNV